MSKSKIAVSSEVLFGKPRIKGTRIAVEQVLACLSQGWTHAKVKKELGISNEDIKACIDFAYRSVSRTHFVNIRGQAYEDGKSQFWLMAADDEIAASFDVSTKKGKKACVESFKALVK